MKLINKLLIVSLLTGVSFGAYETNKFTNHSANKKENIALFNDDPFVVEANGYSLKVNKESLYFEISKNGKTWNSGKLDEADNKTTSLRGAFITSPVTIYYLTSNGGESYYSIFDESHYEYTTVTFTEKNNGFSARIKTFDGQRSNPNLSVNFTLNVLISSNGLDITVSNLVENESKNKISKIVLYPGFGSSYLLNEGYFIIPDGNGAMVDLSEPTSAQSQISLRVYDHNFGITTNTRRYTSSEILSMPMYCINDADKGMIASISSGAEYAELKSKVSGIVDNYNYTYFTFIYRDIYYSYQGLSESSKSPVPQENINEFEPKISYLLFDKNMNYIEYAKEYQNYLVRNGILTKSNKIAAKSQLEFLMAENKKGLVGRDLVKMTSLDFIKNSMNELSSNNGKYNISLLGYSSGGLNNSYPNCFPIESKIGTASQLAEFSNDLQALNIDVRYVVDFVRSYESSGVSKADLALNMSSKLISTPDYYDGTINSFNRLTLGATTKRINEAKNYIEKYNASGLDFLSIGNALFSNHFNTITSRTDSIIEYKSAIKNANYHIGLRKPNMYMFDTFDSYLAMPLESSKFMMETEDIPFLSIILSGYKNMIANPLNLNFISQYDYLKLIDYNVMPSYLLTEEDSIKLKQTTSTNIYSSKFDNWKNNVVSTNDLVTKTLAQFENAKIVNREEISPNVFKVTYNNDKAIVINYNDIAYIYHSMVIKGKGFEVVYE